MSRLLLEIKNLSFIHNNSTQKVFERVSVSLHEGERCALLGANGSGKTTLLNLITGELCGTADVFAVTGTTCLLKQESFASGDKSALAWLLEPFSAPAAVYARMETLEAQGAHDSDACALLAEEFTALGGWELYAKALAQAAAFGWNEEDLARPANSFSGGERKLLAVAGCLLKEPDILLLDEPTNYLDTDGMDLLAKSLERFKGALIVVSHDRAFLDRCVSRVFELERRAFQEYSGNYSAFAGQKEQNRLSAEHKALTIKRQIKKLKLVEHTYKQWGARKEREKIGCGGDKGHIGAQAAKLYKRGMCAQRRALKKIEELEKTKPFVEKRHPVNAAPANTATLFMNAAGLCAKAGERVLFSDLGFYLAAGDRLCVEGKNGSGKSTLLDILAGLRCSAKGERRANAGARVFYLPQFLRQNETLCAEDLFPLEKRQQAFTLLGCMGCGNDILLRPLALLSEGQKKKVELSRLLINGADIALLDEPTTHLDIKSVEVLEQCLLAFEGIVVFASHDAFFRRELATATLLLGGGY